MKSRSASFFEHVFSYKSEQESSSSKQIYEIMIENSQDKELDEEFEIEPRQSKREMSKKYYGPDYLTYMLKSES